jgi:pyruvate/2-oxoglutarate dehydrogenase complex dihydrolipoamide dehydrogenase (E3) component
MRGMERFDIVVIGAGAAGEAAAHYARTRGASVAIIDRHLFGGSCPFVACMPSKALLHAAAVHHAGGDYGWRQASDFRDYMINREGTDAPDDSGHVRSLETAGATVARGTASFIGPGRIAVRHEGQEHELEAGAVILAVGSTSRVPDLPGLREAGYWTNVEGTGTRELPESLVIVGAGPTGVELAQVYARYGVPVTIVHPKERIHDREHPRSTALLTESLERDGVTIRTGVRATRVQPGLPHRLELSDGSNVEASTIMIAIGRQLPLDDLNLGAIGVHPEDGRLPLEDGLRVADGVWAVGDVAGPEMHTHLAHYEGELAAMAALGDDVTPHLDAIPRSTYTDPEVASVGLQLEQARERGIDAAELTADLATSSKGYTAEAKGFLSIVVDRQARTLVGASICGPAASETIHEAVLAVRAGIRLDVLADTIHAFPTQARVLGSLFIRAARGEWD